MLLSKSLSLPRGVAMAMERLSCVYAICVRRVLKGPASVKREREILVGGADVNAPDLGSGGETIEEFAANLRQQGIGNQGIHHASAAFQFRATFGDEGRDGLVIGEGDLVVFLDPFLDPREIQLNNSL